MIGLPVPFAIAAVTALPAPAAQRSVPVEMVNALADETLASCRTMNRDAVVAIADRGGNLIALQHRKALRAWT